MECIAKGQPGDDRTDWIRAERRAAPLIGESLSNDIEAAELQNWYRWRLCAVNSSHGA